MTTQKKSTNPVKVNFWWDLAIFGGFLTAFSPAMTGLALHEWLSLAFGATVVVHLLLHWKWIAAVTANFIRGTSRQARINYLLNAGLFIAVTLIMFSGVMISKTVLPALGLQATEDRFWSMLHRMAADFALWLMALHIALHWKWIVNTLRKYVWAPLWAGLGRRSNTPAGPTVETVAVRSRDGK